MRTRLVVIGNGMVGHRLIETLCESTPGTFSITVFCGESRVAYDRVHLSAYFSHHNADKLSLVEDDYYGQHLVELLLNEQVTQIDRQNKQVISSQVRHLSYDILVLATGSYPWVPPITGAEGQHCFVYRTIDDLDAIERCATVCQRGVVVGGGLLGLEAAGALKIWE
ncbi:MAG: Assimilatory nitrate reductase electron transfer subunit [Candidatus Erwinia impunctatus]|nr:Assimilatory nitrate reductase electron transfer subunit [Culicoides impunctatus]